MRRFTQIKDLSNRRRLPRLGKIRLGIKKEKDGKTYPSETPWFVCPPEVQKVYGEKPTELDIMLPVEDESIVFPQAFELYGSGKGLKCTGDGETALRLNEETKSMEQRACPCEFLEQKKCKQRAHLAVILPKVSVGGIYQIDTSSYNSIVDLNSSIDYVRALIGRFAMVPLKLKREARETHHDGKKQIHYTLRIELEGDVNFVNALRENTSRVLSGPAFVLPPPEQDNPAEDDEAPSSQEERMAVQPGGVEDARRIISATELIQAGRAPFMEAPEIGKEKLLNRLGLATSADDVNEILDLSNSLNVAEEKVAIRKAARQRMQELIKK